MQKKREASPITVKQKILLTTLVPLLALILIFGLLESTVRFYRWIHPRPAWDFSDSGPVNVPIFSGVRKFALKVDDSAQTPSGYEQPPIPRELDLKKAHPILETTSWGYRTYGANRTYRMVEERSNGEMVYDVTYTTDSMRRRVVPLMNANGPFKQHLAVFGCSFTFGEGLNDEQTLPAHLQALETNRRVYNLAREGASIADAIATITKGEHWNGIEPHQGILLVFFSARGHLQRLAPTLRNVGSWNKHGAVIEPDPVSGRYVFRGLIDQLSPWWVTLANFQEHSALLRELDFDWPPLGPSAYEAYAKAIDDLRFYYQQKYGPRNSVVVFFEPKDFRSTGLVPYLEKRQIPYLDYSNLRPEIFAHKPLWIAYDSHPTEEYNRILAVQIHHDLAAPENQALLWPQ